MKKREVILESDDVANALTYSGWLINQARDLEKPRAFIHFSQHVPERVASLSPKDIVRGFPMLVRVWVVGELAGTPLHRWAGDFAPNVFLKMFRTTLERAAGGRINSCRFVRQFHNDDWGIELVLSVEEDK